MLKAKDFRDRAWNHLGDSWGSKVWGTFALIALVYLAISAACGGLSEIGIGVAATIIVSGPLEMGITTASLNVVRGEELKFENLFDGFKNMGSTLVLWLLNTIFTFLWALLFVIPGIVKAYAYSMSFFILRDNPQMSQSEARRMSIDMMTGNKWRLFCLDFSFIGWGLLCALTFGILSVWVLPYIRTAHAEFYQSLIDRAVSNDTSDTEVIEEAPAEPFDNSETV